MLCRPIRRLILSGGEGPLIDKGAVTLESFVPGRGVTTVQIIGAGDAVGWSWLFQPIGGISVRVQSSQSNWLPLALNTYGSRQKRTPCSALS